MNKTIKWVLRGFGIIFILGACSLFGGGGSGAKYHPSIILVSFANLMQEGILIGKVELDYVNR